MLLAACDSHVPLKRAQCEHKAGHPVRALEIVDDFLLKRPHDKAALKLRAKLQKEIVLIDWFSEPEGAMVSRDGEELGPTPLSLTVDPGRHTFRFSSEGYQSLEREENAVAGTHPKLTAVLDRLPGPAKPETPAPGASDLPAAQASQTVPPASPAAPSAEAPRLRQPEVASEPAPAPSRHSNVPLIIGTAGLFVAIGGGVLILTSYLGLNANPSDSAARTRQYVGFALAGVGVALGVSAIIWLLIDRKPGASSAPQR
jgi:hypothetical protein